MLPPHPHAADGPTRSTFQISGGAPVALFWLVLAGLVFALTRAPLAELPFDRDEGEYAYIAWRMQEGEVPYRDAFDQKPPAVFAAFWLAFELFGRSVEAPRWLLQLWLLATAAGLGALVRQLWGGAAAAAAMLVFAAYSADWRIGAATANTESFLLLPMVASLLLALRGASRGAGTWLAAGVCAALACSFKQVALANALHVAALAALLPVPEGAAGRGTRLLAFTAGGVLVAAPLLAAFGRAGALEPLLDAVVWHNLGYAGQRTWAEGLDNLRFALALQAPSFAGVWLLAAAGLLWAPMGRVPRRVLASWLAACGVGAAIGLQFRSHYFVQALPPLSAAAGIGLAAATLRAGRLGPPAAVGVGVLLAACVAGTPFVANRDFYAAPDPAARARAVFGLNPFPEARAIAARIAQGSAPGESVFVLGSEPQILFYAERPSATRYIFVYPLTSDTAAASARQREAMREVEASRPRYVVRVEVPTSLLVGDHTDRWLFRAADRLLSQGHQLEQLWVPTRSGERYEGLTGPEAARWLAAARGGRERLPWLAVYRRID